MRDSMLHTLPWLTYGLRETSSNFRSKCAFQRNQVSLWSYVPQFTVVVSGDPENIGYTLESLSLQTYGHWEALVVTDTDKLAAQWKDDSRIHFLRARTVDQAAAQASGEWVGFLKDGQVLSPVALYEFTSRMSQQTDCSLWYCNEIEVDGAYRQVKRTLSKSQASWFNLIHFNYIGSFFFLRTPSYRELTREPVDSAHELLLRCQQKEIKMGLVPAFLLYEPNALERKCDTHAVKQFLASCTSFQSSKCKVKITAVICFRDKAQSTMTCLSALAKQIGKSELEVILVDNQSSPTEREKIETHISALDLDFKILNFPHAFNYAAMQNRAARTASGDVLLLLNNDVLLDNASLEEWAAWATHPEIGTVGIRLHRPNGALQHGGFRGRLGRHGRLAVVQHVERSDDFAYVNREVFGSSFAACMIRKNVFLEAGLLNEVICPNAYGDVALSFELIKRGFKNIYLGGLSGVHEESKSRGAGYEYWEELAIEQRYPHVLQRMLREDLGYDRLASIRFSLKDFVRGMLVRLLARPAGFSRWLEKALYRIPKLHRFLLHS